MAERNSAGPRYRLACLTTQYPSGSHTFIRREIQELERRGHEILRLAIRRGSDVVDPADQEEERRTFRCLEQPCCELILRAACICGCRPLRAWKALRMALAMGRRSDRGLVRHVAYWVEACALLCELRRNEIDHVHVHFGTNAAAVARLVRCMGGPTYSMTIHGPDEFDAAIGLSLGDKIRDALFTVAISDFCASQLRRWVDHDYWNRIHVVRCHVGPQFLGTTQPVAGDADELVCVGRFSEQKGQLLLLDAFAQVRNQGLPVRLVLVGDGPLRGAIEERIADLGLEGCVELTGWLPEEQVRQRLLDARGLVLASFAEGLPMVLMEALALGRPVVATRIAAIPELVAHGECGWLVTPGNVNELADAICALCETPAARLSSMGLAGAERVRRHHSTGREVTRLERLFDRYVPRKAHEQGAR